MTTDDELKHHYLFPGNLFVRREPHIITTVLGSCVSVCLWDSVLRFGGMNHYMLPLWNGEGLASPKYGNIAIPKLIEKMMDLGSNKSNLKAKVFGGGEVLKVSQGVLNVGERNVSIARDLLNDAGLSVVGSDLGGITGRKIIFNTQTGSVLMKRLKRQIDDIRVIHP
jgi:chemotaxis protein CheD